MNGNTNEFKDINPDDRVIMSPEPSNVTLWTKQAAPAPCIGYFNSYLEKLQKPGS